jgi:hypothetical protein
MPRSSSKPTHSAASALRSRSVNMSPPQNLEAAHYTAELLERITWATTDAEALESRTRAREPGDDTIPSALPAGANPHVISRIRHAPRSAGLQSERARRYLRECVVNSGHPALLVGPSMRRVSEPV